MNLFEIECSQLNLGNLYLLPGLKGIESVDKHRKFSCWLYFENLYTTNQLGIVIEDYFYYRLKFGGIYK